MFLFVDDIRTPDMVYKNVVEWEVVRTYKEAIDKLQQESYQAVSLDHDLGTQETGYDIACWIEEKVYDDVNFIPPVIFCHSSNPVGRMNIETCQRSIENIVSKREESIMV